MTGTTDKGRTG